MNPTPAKLMQIYFNERDQYQHQSLYVALTQLLRKKGLSAVTVRRGIMGYGATGIIQTQRLCPLAANLPVILECIDLPERIEEVVPDVMDMVKEGACLILDGTIYLDG